MSVELNITGMSCGHCKAAVEGALRKVSGVKTVEVSLEQGRARVEGDRVEVQALIVAVIAEGYDAKVVSS